MPEKLDRCVSSLKAKWSKEPDSMPKQFTSGSRKGQPVETDEDKESLAIAICRSSTGLSESFAVSLQEMEDALVSAVLDEEESEPVLRGVAFVNRPYLKFMNPLEVVYRDGKEMIKAQLVKYGIYRHPHGPDGKLPFTRRFWERVQRNWKDGKYGQKVFADKAHQPNAGSLGELIDMELAGDGVNGYFDPTPSGLNAVKSRDVNYASIDLDFSYQGNLISVAAMETPLEEADLVEELFTSVALEDGVELFNPFHDKSGKFTTGSGGGAGAVSTQNINIRQHTSKERAVGSKGLTAALGGMAGSTVGTLIGGGATFLAAAALGLSFPEALAVTMGGAAIGSVIGTVKGSKKGWNLSEIELQDNEQVKSALMKLRSGLSAFLSESDIQYFAFEAESNPGLDQIGFKRQGDYFYVDKTGAKRLVDGLNRLFKQEVAMADEIQVEAPTTPAEQELPEEVKARLTEMDARQAKMDERQAKLDEQWAEFQRERAQQREQLRRKEVEVFLSSLDQPVNGKKMDKGVLDVLRPMLLGDPIQTADEGAIQLSEEPTVDNVHAYYREAALKLSALIPRTVPVESRLDTGSDANPRAVKRNEERELRRAMMIMAKEENKGGVALTAEEIAEIDGKLDLTHGKEG